MRSRSGSEGQKILSEKYRALGRMQYDSYSLLYLIVPLSHVLYASRVLEELQE